jgi:transcriptional regulator with XRE-family HTH domain
MKVKNPACFIFSGVLKRAIRRSGINLIELAARAGIGQPRLSMLLNGKRFGQTTRAHVERLAITLDVPAESCVRRVGQKRRAS